MRSRWRPMRSSSPDSSVRSLSQRNTPFAVPESWTTSWGPSKRKTACTGAMNGSLSSFTSVGSTSRPTRVSSFTRTKSALRLPSRAMAETRARGRTRAAGLGGAGGGRDCPVTGFGGGGGTGRAAAVGLAGAGGFGGGADFTGAAGPFAGAPGAAVAPRGVPQRAQNLKVAALSVMQFGHCFGGAPCASRGAAGEDGGACGFCAMVGRLSFSLIGAPQDRQDPRSDSLCAPQRGQSMRAVLCSRRKKGQGTEPRPFSVAAAEGGSATVSLDCTGKRCAQVGQTPLAMRSSPAGEGPFAGEGLERRNVPAMRPGTPAWLREGVRVLRRCPRAATGASKQSRTPSRSQAGRSEEHTSELQSLAYLVCRLLLEKKKKPKSPAANEPIGSAPAPARSARHTLGPLETELLETDLRS